MNDMISTTDKKTEALTNANYSHDFRSLWNYFFDFGSGNIGNIEPKIDIAENKNNVMIVAEMPGINETDIDLKISEDGYLTISGEKQNITQENTKHNYFKEISYGMFKRTIPLPLDLDYNMASAEYDNGVLTLNIPKSQVQKAKFKKIDVKKKSLSSASDKKN